MTSVPCSRESFTTSTHHFHEVLLHGSGTGHSSQPHICCEGTEPILLLSRTCAGGAGDILLVPQVTSFQPSSSWESPIPSPMSTDSAISTDGGVGLLKLQCLREDPVLPQPQPKREASNTPCTTRLAKPYPPTEELSLGGGSDVTGRAVPVSVGGQATWHINTVAERGDPDPLCAPHCANPHVC